MPPIRDCCPLDVPATRSSSDSANYDLIERVSAGYIMNTVNWDRFRLQTGLRLEATHESGLGYLVNTLAGPDGDGMDNNGNWIGTTPVTNTQSYIDPLPSVQARYAFTSSTAVRAVYARGISRPNQYDLVPYILPNGNTSGVVASIGNPSELPTHASNYDLLLEQQLKPFGLIQTGFFYKQLTNPIVTANVPCTGTCLVLAEAQGAGPVPWLQRMPTAATPPSGGWNSDCSKSSPICPARSVAWACWPITPTTIRASAAFPSVTTRLR